MRTELVIKAVRRDPGRVSSHRGVLLHAEKRVARCCSRSTDESGRERKTEGRPTVDLEARIGVPLHHGPRRVLVDVAPVGIASADDEMFRVLEVGQRPISSLSSVGASIPRKDHGVLFTFCVVCLSNTPKWPDISTCRSVVKSWSRKKTTPRSFTNAASSSSCWALN